MIRKVIDYIKEDSFEVRIDQDSICVINYLSISYMEEEKISVTYLGGSLLIKGKKLSVIKLLEQEMLIRGEFTSIEFRRNHE